jgi:hypothetical protein
MPGIILILLGIIYLQGGDVSDLKRKLGFKKKR